MAKREVTVTIAGEETVSTAANAASGSLTGFAGKIPGWMQGLAILKLGYEALGKALGLAKDFVMDSMAAYDAFSASQTKLAAMSKLTGVSMADMGALVKKARDEFGLSTVASAELTGSVAKFAAQAGAASSAGRLMATALELGAASGMNATQVAEGLTSALAGNDEFLNRLGLANPSQLWKDYAEANGRAVKTLTDTEQKLAVMTAIMDAGNKVAGVYAERMDSGAGAQDRLNKKLDDAKVAFGQATQPARIFIVQGLTSLIDFLGRAALAFGRVANVIVVTFSGAIELARSVVGGFMVAVGKLTGNKELEAWGKTQADAFGDFLKQMDKLEKKYLTTGDAATESASKQTAAVKSVQTTAKAAAETTEQQVDRLGKVLDSKLGKPLELAIGMTEGAIRRLGDSAREQLPPETAAKFNEHMEALAANAEKVRERITATGQSTQGVSRNTKDIASEVAMFARGAVDAAGAFGVIDDAAMRSLNSAISIASALGNMAKNGFSFAGVTGVIGGVASIVSGMMANDAERRQLTRENNTNLKRLTKEIGGLKLDITGEQYTTALGAFAPVSDKLKRGELLSVIENRDLLKRLETSGVTMAMLVKMAKELGVGTVGSGASEVVADMGALFRAMSGTQIGKVGTNFADQLAFFRESQDLNNESGPGKFQRLVEFLVSKGGVGALGGVDFSDPQKAKQSLLALFASLNEGGVAASMLGKISGGTLKDIIAEIIRGLDASTPGGTTSTIGSGVTVDTGTGGTVTVPADSIQSVIGAMNSNLGAILTTHTDLHTRVATATEASAAWLQSIDGKMDRLINVSASVNGTDEALEDRRFALGIQQGRGPTF